MTTPKLDFVFCHRHVDCASLNLIFISMFFQKTRADQTKSAHQPSELGVLFAVYCTTRHTEQSVLCSKLQLPHLRGCCWAVCYVSQFMPFKSRCCVWSARALIYKPAVCLSPIDSVISQSQLQPKTDWLLVVRSPYSRVDFIMFLWKGSMISVLFFFFHCSKFLKLQSLLMISVICD